MFPDTPPSQGGPGKAAEAQLALWEGSLGSLLPQPTPQGCSWACGVGGSLGSLLSEPTPQDCS